MARLSDDAREADWPELGLTCRGVERTSPIDIDGNVKLVSRLSGAPSQGWSRKLAELMKIQRPEFTRWTLEADGRMISASVEGRRDAIIYAYRHLEQLVAATNREYEGERRAALEELKRRRVARERAQSELDAAAIEIAVK